MKGDYYDAYWVEQGFVRAGQVRNSYLLSLIKSNIPLEPGRRRPRHRKAMAGSASSLLHDYGAPPHAATSRLRVEVARVP